MGKEDFTRIPATEGSIGQLHDVINMLSLHGRTVHYGLRVKFRPLGNQGVLIDVFDFPSEFSEILSSVVNKFIVRFQEDLGDITKSTIYKLSPDGNSISKVEFFEPKEQPSNEQLVEEIENQRQKAQDLGELDWDDFLEKYPGVAKDIRDYQALSEDEKKLGTGFVSESEILDVIRRLGLIDPQSQTTA